MPEPATTQHVDLLSQELGRIRLQTVGVVRGDLAAPWGVMVPGSADNRYRTMPSMPTGGFYAVTAGQCWVNFDGVFDPIGLEAGDLIVIFRHRGHVIRDNIGSVTQPIQELRWVEALRSGNPLRHGGGGEITRLVAGGFLVNMPDHHPFLSALPEFIHIPATEIRIGPWIDNTLRFFAEEAGFHGPGSQSLLNHLSQVLFTQAVRAYLARLPDKTASWMTAMQDPEIGAALNHLHRQPEMPWTVKSIADTVVMSRSAFAQRFCALVGEPPLRYLHRCRMARAAELLGYGREAIKRVAASAGYGSEASFSKAFKRVYGVAPGAYRRELTATGIHANTPPNSCGRMKQPCSQKVPVVDTEDSANCRRAIDQPLGSKATSRTVATTEQESATL